MKNKLILNEMDLVFYLMKNSALIYKNHGVFFRPENDEINAFMVSDISNNGLTNSEVKINSVLIEGFLFRQGLLRKNRDSYLLHTDKFREMMDKHSSEYFNI